MELSGLALTRVLSSACMATGLALLVAALLIRCRYAWWVRTEAIHVHHDGHHLLRWHTTRYEIHEEPWPHPSVPDAPPGAAVTVYHHAHHPTRWALTAPYHWLRFLTVVGALLVTAGILVRFLPS